MTEESFALLGFIQCQKSSDCLGLKEAAGLKWLEKHTKLTYLFSGSICEGGVVPSKLIGSNWARASYMTLI